MVELPIVVDPPELPSETDDPEDENGASDAAEGDGDSGTLAVDAADVEAAVEEDSEGDGADEQLLLERRLWMAGDSCGRAPVNEGAKEGAREREVECACASDAERVSACEDAGRRRGLYLGASL